MVTTTYEILTRGNNQSRYTTEIKYKSNIICSTSHNLELSEENATLRFLKLLCNEKNSIVNNATSNFKIRTLEKLKHYYHKQKIGVPKYAIIKADISITDYNWVVFCTVGKFKESAVASSSISARVIATLKILTTLHNAEKYNNLKEKVINNEISKITPVNNKDATIKQEYPYPTLPSTSSSYPEIRKKNYKECKFCTQK